MASPLETLNFMRSPVKTTAESAVDFAKGKEQLSPETQKFKDDIIKKQNEIKMKQDLKASSMENKTGAGALLTPAPTSIPNTQFTQPRTTTTQGFRSPNVPTVTTTTTQTPVVTTQAPAPVTTTTKPVTTTTKPVATSTKAKVEQPKTISGSVEKEITSQTNTDSIATKPINAINAALKAKNEAGMKTYNETKEANKYLGADGKPLTGSARELAIQRESQGKSYSDIRNLPTAEETKDTRAKNVAEQQAKIDTKRKEQQTPTTQLGDAGMLKLDDDQTAAMKMQEVTGLKQSDIATNEADRDRTLVAGEQALEGFRNVVGIDKDGNVDMNRKGSIGATLQRDFDDYKKQQTELSKGYESTRKSRVSSQMRANLLARGVDISKIPQEQLIALSDEVGAKAFEDIYNNKQNTLNAITAKQDVVTSKLNELKQQGLIAEDKYNTLKATVASQFEKTRNDIQRNYVNDIFGITDTAKTKKEGKQTAAFNALESMLKAVPSTDAPALRERFLALVDKGVNVTDIIKAVGADSQFKELAKKLAESTLETEKAEKLQKANKNEAEINKLNSGATKDLQQGQASLVSASKKGSSSSTKVPYADQPLTLTETATLKKDFPDVDLTGMTKGQAMQKINQGQVPAGQ